MGTKTKRKDSMADEISLFGKDEFLRLKRKIDNKEFVSLYEVSLARIDVEVKWALHKLATQEPAWPGNPPTLMTEEFACNCIMDSIIGNFRQFYNMARLRGIPFEGVLEGDFEEEQHEKQC